MLDKLLEMASTPDWISPLVAMVQDRINGPSHIFLIPADCGWSGLEIKRLLVGRGVKAWGLMVIDNFITVSVRLAQAHYAQYLLLRNYIPIEYGVLDERSAPATAYAPKDAPRTSGVATATPKKGPFAELAQMVDSLVDELEALFGL